MKRICFMLALIMAAFVCRAEIITQKPAGNLKYYQRTSGLTFMNDGSTLHLQNQFGFTEIVFSTDGKKAWIKNPVSAFFPEDSNEASWVEATVSNDGKTLAVTLGQQVFYDENQSEYLLLAVLNKDETAETTNFLYDKKEAQVTYIIDGDKVSLQGTSPTKILGLIRNSDKSWTGYGDYQTVYTEYVLPEAITPPASMTKKTYNLTAIEYMNETETKYTSQVVVGIDGSDVYIQGLDKFIPNAWVKGKLTDNEVLFDVQYIGEDPLQRRHFLASWDLGAVGPLTMSYYKDFDAFECKSPLIINSNPTMHNYYAYYRSLFIGERPEAIQLPDGVTPVRMVMAGQSDNTGVASLYKKFTRTAAVAVDGDKVYMRGLSVELPDAWACGTLKDGKVTIPAGQYLGFGEISAIYIHGANDAINQLQDIVFDYNKEENTYTSQCVIIETSAREPKSYLWRYKTGLSIYYDPNAPSGADPDDLPAMAYDFTGECYSYTTLLPQGKFNRKVSVALDGNLVYVKGFSPELPDAWVKGELFDGVVTFENAQPLGTADGQALYFCGVNLETWKLQDFSMSYDEQTESYTFLDLALINKNITSPSYTVWYFKDSKLTKDQSGIEDVTVDDAAEKVIYNLQGIRVKGDLKPGQIYIVNGKKVLYR